MKKLLGLALTGIMCVALAGCATASADGQNSRIISVDESVSLKDGYYTNDNDDTYIRIEGNKMELCGLDYEAYARKSCDELYATFNEEELEKQLPHYEDAVKNTAESLRADCALQEFVPVTATFPDKKKTLLVLNYVENSQAYSGYSLKEDNSIERYDNIYRYYGTELPQ